MRKIITNNYSKLKNEFRKTMTPKFNTRKKTILFLQNQYNSIIRSREYPDIKSIKDYCDILKTLINFAEQNDYNIIVKFKGNCSRTGLLR